MGDSVEILPVVDSLCFIHSPVVRTHSGFTIVNFQFAAILLSIKWRELQRKKAHKNTRQRTGKCKYLIVYDFNLTDFTIEKKRRKLHMWRSVLECWSKPQYFLIEISTSRRINRMRNKMTRCVYNILCVLFQSKDRVNVNRVSNSNKDKVVCVRLCLLL